MSKEAKNQTTVVCRYCGATDEDHCKGGDEGGRCHWPSDDQIMRGEAMMSPTLKPCPFCGSHKVSISRNTWSDGREGRYVECEECEAASGSWPVGQTTVERASELAARKWNRRHKDYLPLLRAQSVMIDAMRQTLENINKRASADSGNKSIDDLSRDLSWCACEARRVLA